MPVIRHPAEIGSEAGPGWSRQEWASSAVFGEAVPMRAVRYRLGPQAVGPAITLAGLESFAYVIAGAGTAAAGGEEHPLGCESVLWLAGSVNLGLRAGPGGLDVLVAEAVPERDGGNGPARERTAQDGRTAVCKVFAMRELPHLVSTRDTRDRLDLLTENVPVGARLIRADRIIYHPGDTAAAHYHTDCHHVFCVLTGSGLLYCGDEALRLTPGTSVLVGPGEEHWFEDDTGEDFSFVEFWAPPPAETIWTVGGDRCTWAPAG